MSTEGAKLTEVFGERIYSYTRSQALADGVLVDAGPLAKEAGSRHPVALTEAVWAEYVAVPEEMKGWQDETGRLWDILWMFHVAVRTGRITGEEGSFEVIIAKPEKGDWLENEKRHGRDHRLVTLKAVCGPNDDGTPCVTIMMPDED